jgi:iron complex transport system permease protein
MNLDARRRQRRRVLAALALLLPASLALSLASGAAGFSPGESLAALFAGGGGQEAMIVQRIRLPRALLAALVGAVLAIAGAAMQGLFRNPLADPSLVGVTAGASLGASLAIVFGGAALPGWLGPTWLSTALPGLSLVSLGAFAGGLAAAALVYRLARSDSGTSESGTSGSGTSGSGTSVATMLLAGIAVTSLAAAVGSLLEYFASNEMLRRISLWRMGGLDGASFSRVGIAAAVGAAMVTALPRYAVALNALLLGESEARHLGIDVDRVKWALILWVAVGVGAAVALAGSIAFVGLVVPHILRLLIGPDHRYLLPAAALGGACLLVLSDTLARNLIAPAELPVGVVTALVGVPFFVSLLRRRHQYGMQ